MISGAGMEIYRAELPRLYELRDCITDPSSPDAYFRNFDENLALSSHIRDIYLRYERDLQELDEAAWHDLKTEAMPYLQRRDKKRTGWEQLFDILNQARAYRYLKAIGCQRLRFIPRMKNRTPDLEGVLAHQRVLCEVKTINPSQEEIQLRQTPPTIRSLPFELKPEFLTKLTRTVDGAAEQLIAYDAEREALHFIYLNICFDDFFAECKAEYFERIDDLLDCSPRPTARLVICNDHTVYFKPLKMRNATVDNIA